MYNASWLDRRSSKFIREHWLVSSIQARQLWWRAAESEWWIQRRFTPSVPECYVSICRLAPRATGRRSVVWGEGRLCSLPNGFVKSLVTALLRTTSSISGSSPLEEILYASPLVYLLCWSWGQQRSSLWLVEQKQQARTRNPARFIRRWSGGEPAYERETSEISLSAFRS